MQPVVQGITRNPGVMALTIVRAGALGDVILTLPAVAALRAAYPDARLRAIGYPSIWAVAGPIVDRVLSIDVRGCGALLTAHPADSPEVQFHGTEGVVAWTSHDPTEALRAAGVTWVVHAAPLPRPGVHAARLYLDSVSLRTGTPASAFDLVEWHLQYSAAEHETARAILRDAGPGPHAVIHPGAGAVWKRWPVEKFASIAAALRQKGFSVALVQGPADEEAVAGVRDRSDYPFPVLHGLGARAVGAVLSQSHLYVGNDSGVTHLAGISGTPTIALFGPTDPTQWQPLGHSTVLRRCTAAASESSGIRVCHDPDCMRAITVDDVLAAIDRLDVQSHVDNHDKSRSDRY